MRRGDPDRSGRLPPQRRAEVSAAFVCCIYVPVVGAVIAVDLIDQVDGLTRGLGLVGAALTAPCLATAGWQVARPGRALPASHP